MEVKQKEYQKQMARMSANLVAVDADQDRMDSILDEHIKEQHNEKIQIRKKWTQTYMVAHIF